MSLKLLYFDEMKGFYKSKVMVVLWIGMPLISLLMQFLNPDLEGIPISSFVAILVAAIGGTLASVMLSTSITNERARNVYDLFLIRPVKRYNILLSKYFAVITCLIMATLLSICVGILIDIITLYTPPKTLIQNNLESFAISLAGMSISCSIGLLIGLLVSSVPVAAILSVYIGNQLSSLIMLPTILVETIDPIIYAVALGPTISVAVLIVSILIFNKKQF
ncbi:MAG: hypothetical protein ACTSWY_06605 [Promethearchaeota archaeon]